MTTMLAAEWIRHLERFQTSVLRVGDTWVRPKISSVQMHAWKSALRCFLLRLCKSGRGLGCKGTCEHRRKPGKTETH